MSKRILLVWELGLNLGHLARLQSLAVHLREQGYDLVAAVRNVRAAVSFFSELNIPLFKAPYAANEATANRVLNTYPEILSAQGWDAPDKLWGLTQSWINLFRATKPELIIADHAPTAVLAAQIHGINTIQIGNGFELPPLTNPLPLLPETTAMPTETLVNNENKIVESINKICLKYNKPHITHVAELFYQAVRFLACFGELDHYGTRTTESYWGPLLPKSHGTHTAWPEGNGPKIFTYLALPANEASTIIRGLALGKARIVCVAPSLSRNEQERLKSVANIRFTEKANLTDLSSTADLCVSHGAEGTVSVFLLSGVPQLIRPHYLESYIAARRVEQLNAGLLLRGKLSPEVVAVALDAMLSDCAYKMAATNFAKKYEKFIPTRTADLIARKINDLLN